MFTSAFGSFRCAAVALAAASVFCAQEAEAAVISGGTQPFWVFATTWGDSDSQSMLFTGFNPALGTLTGVSLELSTVSVAASVQTTAYYVFATGTVSTSIAPAFAIKAGASDLMTGGTSASANCFAAAFNGCYATGSSSSYTGLVPNPASLASEAWGAFIGPGTVVLQAEITSMNTSATGSVGDIERYGTASWSGNLTVTYTYEAVPVPPQDIPEPASLVLLGAGVALLGLGRRRKEASSFF